MSNSKNVFELRFQMVDFKKRSEIHLARKIWHLLTVSGMAGLYAYLPERLALTILIFAWIVFVPLDFARQRSESLNDLLLHVFRPIIRDSEARSLAGTTFLLTGVTLIVLIFPHDIVLLSLLFLAFADPFASYFGICYGKDKIFGHKSVQGSLAAFVVCAILSFVYMYTHGILLDRLLMVSLLGGLIGALAELIPCWKLDDNLTLPVFSATFLWLLFTLFGAS